MINLVDNISTHVLGKPRLEVDVIELEPFLINRGQILKNRRIVFCTFSGRAVIFAVEHAHYERFKKRLPNLYIPRELPAEPGTYVCTVTVANTGRKAIGDAVIDLVSYSSFIQREQTPNIGEIFYGGFPTEGFECRFRPDTLEPGQCCRIVFALDRDGIARARYAYNNNLPGRHLMQNHFYIRPLEREKNILILDSQKVRLPEFTEKGINAHLLHSNCHVWEKIKIKG